MEEMELKEFIKRHLISLADAEDGVYYPNSMCEYEHERNEVFILAAKLLDKISKTSENSNISLTDELVYKLYMFMLEMKKPNDTDSFEYVLGFNTRKEAMTWLLNCNSLEILDYIVQRYKYRHDV